MNKISDRIKDRCVHQPLGVCDSCMHEVVAVERLVQAVRELSRHNKFICPCSSMDAVWEECDAALKPFESDADNEPRTTDD